MNLRNRIRLAIWALKDRPIISGAVFYADETECGVDIRGEYLFVHDSSMRASETTNYGTSLFELMPDGEWLERKL